MPEQGHSVSAEKAKTKKQKKPCRERAGTLRSVKVKKDTIFHFGMFLLEPNCYFVLEVKLQG